MVSTVCPGSLVQLYIVSRQVKMDKTYWTYGNKMISHQRLRTDRTMHSMHFWLFQVYTNALKRSKAHKKLKAYYIGAQHK